MKKYFGLTLFIFLFQLLHPSMVGAVTLSPSTGTYSYGDSFTIQVTTSAVGDGSDAVQLRLGFTDLTVTGYSAPGGSVLSIGVCSGGSEYTSSSVCLDMTDPGGFGLADSLGTISVTVSGDSPSITKDAGNGYLFGTTLTEDLGSAGFFTVIASSLPSTLPSTDLDKSTVILIVGIVLVIISLLVYKYKFGRYFSYKLLENTGVAGFLNKFSWRVLGTKNADNILDKRIEDKFSEK